MYYATYKDIGKSDIAAFKDEKDRDDWVNFKDPYSKVLGVNATNSTFERVILMPEDAEQRIKFMLHIEDELNPGQEWYIVV